jgi:hypothetical protein
MITLKPNAEALLNSKNKEQGEKICYLYTGENEASFWFPHSDIQMPEKQQITEQYFQDL